MRRRQICSAILFASLAACATSGTITPDDHAGDISRAGRSSDVINQKELNDVEGVNNVWDAITRLRPFFLRRTREMSPIAPNRSLLTVYMDELKLGGIETLQGIPLQSIKSVTYLSSSEATIRWGTNHAGGVILLSTR